MHLGRQSLDLLFDVLDQPRPVLAGSALADYVREGATPLVATGLLVSGGHEAFDSSRDDDDLPVQLDGRDDQPDYGFFDPAVGWRRVASDRLTLYRVDPSAMRTALVGSTVPTAQMVLTDEIWELGELEPRHNKNLGSLFLVRRAADPSAWKRIRQWLIENPPAVRRVLLCTSTASRLPTNVPALNVLLSLRDMLVREATMRLDPTILLARINGPVIEIPVEGPLVVRGEGREVWLHGEVFWFPRGATQRRIICALYGRYLEGEHAVSIAWLTEELELKSGRIRDYFKSSKPPVMGRMLWEKNGMCGFCLSVGSPDR